MSTLVQLQLYRAARYFTAALIALPTPDDVTLHEPVNLLLGFSVEISLKAYLLSAGVAQAKLRSRHLGHNLANLLRLSIEKGLLIDGDSAGALLNASPAHENYYFRYGPADFSEDVSMELLPSVPHLIPAAAALIDLIGTDPTIIRGTSRRPTAAFDFPITMPIAVGVTVPQIDEAISDISQLREKIKRLAEQVRERHSPQP